uniref:Kazal-like domain-containing protein n=1 Tax=Panagrellus redivivus TaxID=6233 RepID=A0A7E4UXF5_PANRE
MVSVGRSLVTGNVNFLDSMICPSESQALHKCIGIRHNLTFQATLPLPINDDSRSRVHRSQLLNCGICNFSTFIIYVEGLSVIPYSIRDWPRLHVISGLTVPLPCRPRPLSSALPLSGFCITNDTVYCNSCVADNAKFPESTPKPHS